MADQAMTTTRDVIEEHVEFLKRTSWGAIFVGVVHVLAIMLTLGLLGAAIGLATIDPVTEQDPAWGLGTGAMIWWFLTGIIAIFIGAYVAASLTGIPKRSTGVWHGLTVWGFSVLLLLFLAGNMFATAIGGAFSALRATANIASQGAVAAAAASNGQQGQSSEMMQDIREEIKQRLPDTAAVERQTRALEQKMQNMTQGTQQPTGMPPDRTSQRMEQRTEEMAGRAASVGAKAAAWGFVLLVVGAASGAIGGAIGAPKEEILTHTETTTRT